jgi:PPOX class probable F420-dependent enzyme
MRLDPADAMARFTASPVARLATAGLRGMPHLVPCTFAIDGSGRIVIGIDDKPKTTRNLRRLANIEQNPRVSLLADQYADDWQQLWWARADGTAAIVRDGGEHAEHWRLLIGKYPQYAGEAPAGPTILVTVTTWSGWAYSEPDADSEPVGPGPAQPR